MTGISPAVGSMLPYMSAAVMSGDITHMAVPRSETSISIPSPLRSRRKRAAATPPARHMPPMKSPKAGPGVVGEVDPDAPLVPADLLDDEVAPRGSRDEPPGDEAPDRIADTRVLDLDDLRAPVSQGSTGRGDEAPVRDLEHPDAVQY